MQTVLQPYLSGRGSEPETGLLSDWLSGLLNSQSGKGCSRLSDDDEDEDKEEKGKKSQKYSHGGQKRDEKELKVGAGG